MRQLSGRVGVSLLVVLAVVVAWRHDAWAQCGNEEKLTASDAAAEHYFGYSLAVDGNVMIVGAPGFGGGAAYVYRFDGTHWVEEQKLTASDGVEYDWFGGSISLSRDVALIGAVRDDASAGSAYVFRFDGTNWVEEQKLTASDGAAWDYFGTSVSVSGDVAVIGADNGFGALRDSGVAYVCRFDGTTWREEQKLMPDDGATGDQFGCSVALTGDMALIGAQGDDDGRPAAGATYVYRFDGRHWVVTQKLRASDARSADYFGYSVSMNGDVAVIGAPYADDNLNADAGSAYLYRFDGTEWLEEQKLVAADAAPDQYLGVSVCVRDDVAVIGASGKVYGGGTGAAYVFKFEGTTWQGKVEASDAAPNDGFGCSVSMNSDTVVAGAWGDDDGGPESGSAYVYPLRGVPRQGTYGQGWPGAWIPSLATTFPKLGSLMTLSIRNSSFWDTTGVLLVGLEPADIQTGLGGTLLVTPVWTKPLYIPWLGLTLEGFIPEDPALCGLAVYAQVLELDAYASQGVSFTPGLVLYLGE
ncbi:MAG: hypothetical protein AB1486_21375 [Planctomycetota bacterium]